jgi:4-amino-4-deoxychorismate lyase
MNVYPFVYYQEKIRPAQSVPFPYDDYGFLYGYGLFETVRIFQKKPILFDKHWERLQSSAIIMGIELAVSQTHIRDIIADLVQQNKIDDGAILNIYITPGDRPVGTHRIVMGRPMVLVILRPMTQTRTNIGIHLGIRQESFQRIQIDQFKMLSYVKNILEKALCDPYDDVILYSEKKTVLETPTANVFFARGNVLFTPKSQYILPGVTRRYLLEKAEEFDVDICEKEIVLSDIDEFHEVFLTSSLKGIVLVDKLEKYPNIKSRELTRALQQAYNSSLGLPTLPEIKKTV